MFKSYNRALFIYRLLCLSFLLGIILSKKLWFSDRLLPLIPTFRDLNFLPHPFDKVFLLLLGVFLFLGLFIKRVQLNTIFILFISFLFCFSDQIRWQPWIYQYLLMFVPFAFFDYKKSYNIILILEMIVIIFIYFWTGIHKFQPQFIYYVFTPILKNLFHLSSYVINEYRNIGYVIPIIEIGISFFLFFRKTRNFGVIFLLFSHLFILYYLSPLGINFNQIVWPWNTAMIGFGFLLFFNNNEKIMRFDLKISERVYFILFFILVGVLPFFSLYNKWDHYLSFNVYSGKPNELAVIIPENKNKVPRVINEYLVEGNLLNTETVINLNRWSMFELNVPIPPQKRIYKLLSKKVVKHYNFEGVLLIRELKNKKSKFYYEGISKTGKNLPDQKFQENQ